MATADFVWEGLIDWKAGTVLGIVSFAGAVLGTILARRMGNVWLRRVFLAAVVILALKLLFHEVVSPNFWNPTGARSACRRKPNRLR